VVGEVYGEQLDVVQEVAFPNSYFQSSRYPAFNGFNALRPAGFIFKTDVTGNILLSTYFSPSDPIENYSMTTRLQEIDFDNLGNYFVTGLHFTNSVQDDPIPSNYNIPIPSTQPVGFYQKNTPTYSTLSCITFGIDRESYIVGFNSNDEHIWSTYVSGFHQDQIKPIVITSNNHLYFAGSANTINSNVDFNCSAESNSEKDQIKFPYWDFNSSITTDWYNPDGANQTCEFAGRFDITGVNDPGPVLSTEELPQSGGLIVYPNPNVTGQLYVYIGGETISSVRIYSMDGKINSRINRVKYCNSRYFSVYKRNLCDTMPHK
jgi:hypothetical protein